ncbi:MAG: flagellar basal body L-ring protein FlgH, partial [Gammaproteobacteria bacterium]
MLNCPKVLTTIAVIGIWIVFLSGCQTEPKRDPAFSAVRPPLPPVRPAPNGAIYQAGFDVRLFEDVKARRVGDI